MSSVVTSSAAANGTQSEAAASGAGVSCDEHTTDPIVARKDPIPTQPLAGAGDLPTSTTQ